MGTGEYMGEGGTMRRKKTEPKHMQKQPIERSKRKDDVSSGNAKEEIEAKKKAPRPNAATGKAVAVPRWVGQLFAAATIIS